MQQNTMNEIIESLDQEQKEDQEKTKDSEYEKKFEEFKTQHAKQMQEFMEK